MTSPKRPPKSTARQYAESLGLALILAVVLRSSFVEAYVIPSGSMEPTILVGDHILVNKMAYGLRIPETIAGVRVPGLSSGKYLLHLSPIRRGDIIVFVSPRDRSVDLIKRVIGLPGDRIQVINGVVWRNGARITDTHAFFERARERAIAVLGDRQFPAARSAPSRAQARAGGGAAGQAFHDGRQS